MVECDAGSEVLTRGSTPPATRPKPSTSSSGGNSFQFRLNGIEESAAVDRASSVITSSDQQSIYKQRIDAMFDESRSLLYGCAPSRPVPPNTVQVKIERMFQEVASSQEPSLTDTSLEQQQFKVYYLGNVALTEKDTTLVNLQKPLKELYFKYLESELNNCKPPISKLEISTDGLNVLLENRSELNPFSTIAVWAAVKCVSKDVGKKLAFLPLIADPDGQDKSALFFDLNFDDDMNLAQRQHSPLLAVVMRHSGTSRQLFCHGYVCSCSEDAIVMAANLYQALMANMKLKRSSSVLTTEQPVRPPRKTKSKTSSEDEEIMVEPKENPYLTQQSRVSSKKMQDPSGDILTKVAIPRSRSFLMKNPARGGNSSLHDLFTEIRTQEGITNMDEVLEKIVNKNGMSFNDLKPLYKELLLKLAVTLTKDELYLRSKNIMKKQQKATPAKRTPSSRRKKGLKYAFRRSVKKIGTSVNCHKQPPSSFEFTSIIFPSTKKGGPHRNSMASSCSSYPTMRRRRDRVKKQKEAVESRLSSIANREIRRNVSPKNKKSSAETPSKRESSSGYVSCSECSLTSCLCDTDSCLESDKCYCSLQNNKKHVVTSTSWRHHLNKPPTTHTSRSLQKLLEQPLEQPLKRRLSSYTSRMDVYDAIPIRRTSSSSVSSRSKPRFSSADNLALDYELFRYSAQQNRFTNAQQRVLVVSARDNQGRLIYMGAADKDKRKIRSDPASEALAVKKSAEIASLFSDMKLSQTTNVRGLFDYDEDRAESDYHELEPPEHPQQLDRCGSYPGSTLETSLGYLP